MDGKEVAKEFYKMMTNFQYSLEECDKFIDLLTTREIREMLKEMCRCWEHIK